MLDTLPSIGQQLRHDLDHDPIHMQATHPTTPPWLRYLLYPMLAAITAAYVHHELSESGTPGRHYGAYLAGMLGLMVLIETCWPLQRRWRMTAATLLRRDLPYMLLGASTLGLTQWLATQIATSHGVGRGSMLASLPLAAGALASVLMGDFLWYWVHRSSHELPGRLGRFLWRLHLPHHLPEQVYVLMHPIAHPLNTLIVRIILTLPGYLLGVSVEAAFVASVLTGFQGLVSHFNVDSRTGWLNRLLIGTELHRLHHSADPSEARNYAATVSIWDQLFGTYRHAPGQVPARLGIEHPERYPAATDLAAVLTLPFRRQGPSPRTRPSR
jgi:sterol desaturase/sphingolipid hydroxylase (fatty acid hydroxylase superfamily)